MFGRRFSKKIAAWQRAFESRSPEHRLAVARELMEACHGERDLSAALPLLERLTADPSGHVRARACDVVGHLECDRQSLHTSALAALADPAAEVRAKAAFALGRMADRSPTTFGALVVAVRDVDPEVRGWALSGLGRFGSEAASRPLADDHLQTILSALADADVEVRKSALSALEALELPEQQLVAPLIVRLHLETAHEVLSSIRQIISSRDLQRALSTQLSALLTAAASNPPAAPLIFEIFGTLGACASAALPPLEAAVASTEASFEAVHALWTLTGSTEKCIPALVRMLERT